MAKNTWKDAQYHYLLEKCKSKVQRYHLMLVRMAINKNFANNKCLRGYGEREPSFSVGGTLNLYSPYEEQYGGSLNN